MLTERELGIIDDPDAQEVQGMSEKVTDTQPETQRQSGDMLMRPPQSGTCRAPAAERGRREGPGGLCG